MTKTPPQARTGRCTSVPYLQSQRSLAEEYDYDTEADSSEDDDDWITSIDDLEGPSVDSAILMLLTEDDLDAIISLARYSDERESPLGDFNFLTRDGCYRNGKPLYTAP